MKRRQRAQKVGFDWLLLCLVVAFQCTFHPAIVSGSVLQSSTLRLRWERGGFDRQSFSIDFRRDEGRVYFNDWDGSICSMEINDPSPSVAKIDKRFISSLDVSALSWNPQGLVLATGDRSGKVALLAGTMQILNTIETGFSKAIERLSWEESGRWLAAMSGDVLIVYVADGKLAPVGAFHNVVDFAWSPAGAEISIVQNGKVSIFSASDFSVALDSFKTTATAVAWDRDAKSIWIGGLEGSLRQFSGKPLSESHSWRLEPVTIKHIAWDPTGSNLAVLFNSNLSQIYKFPDDAPVLLDQYVTDGVFETARWCRQGALIYAEYPRSLYILKPGSTDCGTNLSLTATPKAAFHKPSNSLIVAENIRYSSGMNHVLAFDVKSGKRKWVLETTLPIISSITFDPAGKYVAFMFGIKSLEIWSLTERQMLGSTGSIYVGRPLWSPDSNRILIRTTPTDFSICDNTLSRCQTIHRPGPEDQWRGEIGWVDNEEILFFEMPSREHVDFMSYRKDLIKKWHELDVGIFYGIGLSDDRSRAFFHFRRTGEKEESVLELDLASRRFSILSGYRNIDSMFFDPCRVGLESPTYSREMEEILFKTEGCLTRDWMRLAGATDPRRWSFCGNDQGDVWSYWYVSGNEVTSVNSTYGTIRSWNLVPKLNEPDRFDGLLAAVPVLSGVINLIWNPPEKTEKGSYLVCISKTRGECLQHFAATITTPGNPNGFEPYRISSLTPRETYYIVVRWRNADGVTDQNKREMKVTVPEKQESPLANSKNSIVAYWYQKVPYCTSGRIRAISSGTSRFITYCSDDDAELWDAESEANIPTKIATIKEKDRRAFLEELSPNDQYVSGIYFPESTQRVNRTRIYIKKPGEPDAVWEKEFSGDPRVFKAWHPSSQFIATAGCNQPLRVFESSSGRLIRESPSLPGCVTGMAWDPKGVRLGIIYADELRIWNAEDDSFIRSGVFVSPHPDQRPPAKYVASGLSPMEISYAWHAMALSSSGELIAIQCGRGYGIIARVSDFRIVSYINMSSGPRRMIFSPSDNILALAYGDADSTSSAFVDVKTGNQLGAYAMGWPIRWIDDKEILTIYGVFRVSN